MEFRRVLFRSRSRLSSTADGDGGVGRAAVGTGAGAVSGAAGIGPNAGAGRAAGPVAARGGRRNGLAPPLAGVLCIGSMYAPPSPPVSICPNRDRTIARTALWIVTSKRCARSGHPDEGPIGKPDGG